ncbi:MAG: ribulose phosphate epimerase [Myxococcota bacterium]
MSKADIDFWIQTKGDHMPNIGGTLGLKSEFNNAAGPAEGGFTKESDPVQGGGGFITEPDGGGVAVECDIWAQDCEKGEKCAAYSNDGSGSWNATRCVPVVDDPVGEGETCIAESGGTSGFDNCDATSMCWGVDGETGEGTCVALCEGNEAAPTCAPEATACSISNEGVLILCLPICNPLADECPEGQGCYPIDEFFQCAPEANPAAAGEECQFINGCEDGTGCVNAPIVPGCTGGACCSSFCEIGDDSTCLDGQECVPWYEMGQAPEACLEGVGICAVPA